MGAAGYGGEPGGIGDAGAELGELIMGSGGSWGRRWARIIRPSPRQEVDEELEFHLEERIRDYMDRGMDAESARAAALTRLGDVERARRESAELLTAERRTERRRHLAKVSWLDFKLGFRMLVKYPGMTIIGGLAMAFAIWVGAGTFEFVRQVLNPALPLSEGHRVVGVLTMDAERSNPERRIAWEFVRWRGELETIDHLGAFRTLERNLITGDGVGEPVELAEITASGFEVARVAPLLGRTLVPGDEVAGAPPVVVLGHSVWQERYGSDPAVVGKQIRLGSLQPTVVGVMPEDFRFPVQQNMWMPLQRTSLDHEPREGPGLIVFGRLAPDASYDEAQAELAAFGRRAAADQPATHEHLRPRVVPYAKSVFYLPSFAALGLSSMNLFVVMLLVLICGNVALLMFARAATRESELLVRTALGASRGRIIGQLFVEALVLGTIAAALGLSATGFGMRWMYGTLVAELGGPSLPFWFSPRLSTGTIVYAVGLTLLAATVSGVVPALKVTGPKVEARLKEMGARGGGLKFGGVWTAVIVAQIAATAVFPLFGIMVRGDARSIRSMPVNFPEEEYLAVRLEMDPDAPSVLSDGPGQDAAMAGVREAEEVEAEAASRFEVRFRAAAEELEQRLEARPDVGEVTFGDRLPRMYHPHRLIEIDSGGAAPLHPDYPAGYRVSNVAVTPDYFDALQVEVRNGRGFHSGDLGENVHTVLVNESFVRQVLGGRNPLGRRLRYVYFENEGEVADPESEPWHEIVGVVPDMGLSWSHGDPKSAGIYHPVAPGGRYPIHMAIQVAGDMGEVSHEMRALAATVDPALRLHEAIPLARVDDSELRFYSFWFWILLLVSAVAVTLSLAGIYAAMSFAVARRTREIGIRVALGASRPKIVASIFRRPLIQVALGLLLGGFFLATLGHLASGNIFTPRRLGFLAAYMTVSAMVCLLACVVPTRRALGVEPAEALRAE